MYKPEDSISFSRKIYMAVDGFSTHFFLLHFFSARMSRKFSSAFKMRLRILRKITAICDADLKLGLLPSAVNR